MRLFVALLQWHTWRLAAFTPSPIQIAQLRLAAKFATLDTEFCGAIDGLPGPTELQFAANPLFKFFAYDPKEDFTWVLREDVQQCLESVRNSNANGTEWIVQSNLWEAAKEAYQKLGEAIEGPGDWNLFQQWMERSPTPITDTVLRTATHRTAPMSSLPDHFFLQQPCNSFSNYAYYEISLEACSNDFNDFDATWPWKSEVIAGGALLAFGSFAMHSNPIESAALNTGFLDVFAIQVLFFLLYQGYVRTLAVNASEPAIGIIFGVFPDQPFGDARDVMRQLQSIVGGPASGWVSATALEEASPTYQLGASALVAVILHTSLSETVGPVFTPVLYREICVFLVESLLAEEDRRPSREALCEPSSAYVVALATVTWKVPPSISRGWELFFGLLEEFLQAGLWQEELPVEENYFDRWLDLVNVSLPACWRMPHANWHRISASLISNIVRVITQEVQVSYAPPADRFPNFVDGLPTAIANALALVNTVVAFIGQASSLNYCRIFELAKFNAEASIGSLVDTSPSVLPLFDKSLLNQFLSEQAPDLDRLLVDSELGAVKYRVGDCSYELKDAKVTDVQGFTDFALEHVAVNGSVPSSSASEKEVRAVALQISMESRPITLRVKAAARTMPVLDDAKSLHCNEDPQNVEANMDVALRLSSSASGTVDFKKMLAGESDTVTARLASLDLDLQPSLMSVNMEILPSSRPFLSHTREALESRLKSHFKQTAHKMLHEKLGDVASKALDAACRHARGARMK